MKRKKGWQLKFDPYLVQKYERVIQKLKEEELRANFPRLFPPEKQKPVRL